MKLADELGNAVSSISNQSSAYASQVLNTLLGGDSSTNSASSTYSALTQLFDENSTKSVSSISGIDYMDYSLKNYYIQSATFENSSSAVSSDSVQSLATLAQALVSMKTENDALKVKIQNEKLKVDVSNFEENAKQYIENQVALILKNALTESMNYEDEESNTSSLSSVIRDIETYVSLMRSDMSEINQTTQSIRTNSMA